MNGVDWLAQRIMDAANRDLEAPASSPRFNPRPPGVIREGSATQQVLKFLEDHPGRYFIRIQIVRATRCSERAVDWALLFLRAQERIKAIEDPTRNARYLRYGIAKEGEA